MRQGSQRLDGAAFMTEQRDRWKRRIALAWLVRAVALAVPFTASFGATIAAGRLFNRADGLPTVAWWFGVVPLAAAAFLVGFNLISRRLLPLAALLELDVAFPHEAPSRLRVVLAATRQPRVPPTMRRAPTGNGSRHGVTLDRLTRAIALGVQPKGRSWRSERLVTATAALLTATAFVTSLFLGQADTPGTSSQPDTSKRAAPALTTGPAPPVANSSGAGVEQPETTVRPVGRAPRPSAEPTPAEPPIVTTPSPGAESAPAVVRAQAAIPRDTGAEPTPTATVAADTNARGAPDEPAPAVVTASAAIPPETEPGPTPTTTATPDVNTPSPPKQSPPNNTDAIAKWLRGVPAPTAALPPPPAEG